MHRLLLAASLVTIGAVSVGAGLAMSPDTSTGTPVYVARTQSVRNAAFYYGGLVNLKEPQTAKTMTALRNRLGNPGLVVVSPGGTDEGDRNVVTNLRQLGHIRAIFRYVNLYSEPAGGSTDLPMSGLGWTFCSSGTTPPVARVVNGTPWYFLNPSSSEARSAVTALFQRLHNDGYTGIMIDRGQIATQYASYSRGQQDVKFWFRHSTCNGGAQTFADGFTSWAALAQHEGLKVFFNNGISAFAPPMMRPDPTNTACQHGYWDACTHLNDLWRNTNLVLDESATALRDIDWARNFAGNHASESDRAHGHRTVTLITTRELGGTAGQNKVDVYYAWSRIKLFNLPVAINTGEGGCSVNNVTNPCNHYGFHSALTSIQFGRPLTAAPSRASCSRGSRVHCVWHRSYAAGMDVVNVSPTRKTVTLELGTRGCRYVTDVSTGRLLSPKCVSSVQLTLRSWTGRPLTYSRVRPS